MSRIRVPCHCCRDRHGHQHGGGRHRVRSVGRFGPKDVAVTPDGKHVYVPNSHSNTVFGDRHVHQHGGGHDPGGDGPFGVAITRMGHTPTSPNSGRPTRLGDRHGHQQGGGATDSGGGWPQGVAVTPDGKHAYVANEGHVPQLRHCFGDRHGHQHGGGHGHGGDCPPWGRRHAGWESTSMSVNLSPAVSR